MGKAFLCKSNGGGGGGLAFRVIGGTSAPSNPKPNDIWVNTDKEITSYIFSATEPEGYMEGMVWFTTATSSTVEFNALKKNGITVYPISAKQYAGGAWVDKTAKSYQGGQWVDWVQYFYNKGSTFDDVTGGYYSNKVDTTNGKGYVTFETDKITLFCDGQAEAIVRTRNKIDLSNFSTLHLDVDVRVYSDYDNSGYLHFYATENAITATGQAIGTGTTTDVTYPKGTDIRTTVSLDVSGVTGSKYIFVALKTTQKAVDVYCDILEIKGE